MKKKILIVANEQLICYSLSFVLQGARTEVSCAINGRDAIREIRSRTFDLCLLDMHLSDVNGADLLPEIKRLSPQTEIIAMSNGDRDDALMGIIREHSTLHLSGPLDALQVKALVEELFEQQIDESPDLSAMASCVVNEKRLHDRKPFMTSVKYDVFSSETDAGHWPHFADTIDICMQGLGIRTNVRLEPGRIIRLKSNTESVRGIVRWITPEGEGEVYRAGIQFVR